MTIPEKIETPQIPPVYRRDSSLAIASLVCGLAAWFVVPFFGALAAVITGHLSRKEIRESNGAVTGDGMAVAGLILGYVQLGLILLVAVGISVFFIVLGSSNHGTLNGPLSLTPFLLALL